MASFSSLSSLTRQRQVMLRAAATAVACTALASTAVVCLSGCSSESQGASALSIQAAQPASATLPTTKSAPDLLIDEADAEFQQHSWDWSVIDYTAALSLYPPHKFVSMHRNDKYVLHKLSLSHLYQGLETKSQGDYYVAEQEFQSALDDDSGNSAARRLLAEVTQEDEQRTADRERGQEELADTSTGDADQTPSPDSTDQAFMPESAPSADAPLPSDASDDAPTTDQQAAGDKFADDFSAVSDTNDQLTMRSTLPPPKELTKDDLRIYCGTMGMKIADMESLYDQLAPSAQSMYGKSELEQAKDYLSSWKKQMDDM